MSSNRISILVNRIGRSKAPPGVCGDKWNEFMWSSSKEADRCFSRSNMNRDWDNIYSHYDDNWE